MRFLSPGLLWVGLAAAVPVILHLLHRHQGPRITFPALRYLRRAEREHARRIRLRQLALLVLRVMAILLVVGAAARPLLPGAGRDHLPTAVALVLDNSLSSGVVTGEARLFDRLRRLGLATVDAAGPGDRIWVVRAAGPEDAPAPSPPERARKRIEETEPTDGGADLDRTLERAALLLAESGLPGREIHLLSDLQATAFPGEPGAVEVPVVAYRPPEPPPPNRFVTSVEAGGGLPPRESERFRVAVTTASGTDGASDTVPVRIVVDGSVRATGSMAGRGSTLLTLPPLPAGRYAARAEIDPDALRADDRRHFVLNVVPPPGVTIRGPDEGFITEAVEVLREARRVRSVPSSRADVVLAMAGEGAVAVRRGAAVVILPPADRAALPALNRRLARAGIPWRFDPAGDEGSARITRTTAPVDGVRVDRAYRLVPTNEEAPARTLATLETGAPWAIAGSAGEGRYLLLATPLVPGASPLPVSERMIPFVEWLLTGWAAPTGKGETLRVGDPLPLPPGAVAHPPENGTPAPDAGTPTSRIARTAGVYRFVRADSVVGLVAVNPPPEESRLARVSPGDLTRRYPGAELTVVRDTAAWTGTIFRSRRGGEAWWPLLAIAGLLLAAELWVAAAGGRALEGDEDRQVTGES